MAPSISTQVLSCRWNRDIGSLGDRGAQNQIIGARAHRPRDRRLSDLARQDV